MTELLARPVYAWRALVAAMLLSIGLGVALTHAFQGRHAASPAGAASPAPTAARLPTSAWGAVSAAVGAHSAAYQVRESGAGELQASNPVQHLHATFGGSGVTLRSGGIREGLSLSALGFGESLAPIGRLSRSAAANRVRYAGAGVAEWFANGPAGIEQGFRLTRAPSGARGGPLTLSMALAGDARVAVALNGQSATVSRPGQPSLRYGALAAVDARGHALRSWLQLDAGRLLLRVDSGDARYPLRIDPLVQQAKLVSGAPIESHFGRSVAVSADGNTALVGGPHDQGHVGAAWVFTRTGSIWTEQAEIEGVREADEYFGRAVALSGDGDTALIGDPGAGEHAGAAWVYTRSGSTWTPQQKLEGGGEIGAGEFGARVALSSDGTTALVGALADNEGSGAAWVFAREGASWTQQTELTGGGELGKGQFGRGVALSGDGSTALVGGTRDDKGAGAAWVFTRTGSAWTQQEKLEAGGEVGKARFGTSVALSSDGTTALIGGSGNDEDVGAAWIFTHPGVVWLQRAQLEGGEEVGDGEFGGSVALSADGTSALIGGAQDAANVGAVWQFTGSGATWVQQGAKLTAEEELGESTFGFSVASSADASTVLIGGVTDGGDLGAAWVFGQPASVTPAPTVTTVEPDEGPEAGGTTVAITGTGFTESSAVSFGSEAATAVEVQSPTEISAISPEGSGAVDVTVETVGGTSATGAGDQFTYTPPSPTGGTGTGTGTGSGTGSGTGGQTGPASGLGVLPFFALSVPPPQPGSGNIAPVSGTILVEVPGSSTFVVLSSLRQVPFGTVINATNGHVVVTTVGPHGGVQTGEFFGGEFVLAHGHKGVVFATLAGGNFRACPTRRERAHVAGAPVAEAARKRVVRKLWANAHGSFTTKGNYAVGAVQGTEWLTEDLCGGTLIRVTRDKVGVTNLVNHTHHLIKVGHSYLAKAP